MKVYGIFDVKVSEYLPPFYANTHGQALRLFTDHTNDPSTPIYRHPEDYRLFHLAEFDQATGAFISRDKPEHLGDAADVKDKTAPPQLDITDAINRKIAQNKRTA